MVESSNFMFKSKREKFTILNIFYFLDFLVVNISDEIKKMRKIQKGNC